MGVQLLAECTYDGWLVKLIVLKELEGLSVEGDVDLADGVVKGGLNVALSHTRFQPGVEQAEAISALNLTECSTDEGEISHDVDGEERWSIVLDAVEKSK